jgi:multidrug efflux pump subunit AcrA (membrane-fusion protein)
VPRSSTSGSTAISGVSVAFGTIRRIITSFVLSALLLTAGTCTGVWLYRLRKEPPRKETSSLPPVVEVITVTARPVVEQLIGYGVARADRVATVAAEVPGVIREWVDDLEAGSPVEESAPLVRLDDREYAEVLRRTESQLEAEQARRAEIEALRDGLTRMIAIAQRELRIATDEQSRVTALFEENQANKREYDLARLGYEQARRTLEDYETQHAAGGAQLRRSEASMRAVGADLAVAKLNLERCEIRAPFAGVVEEILAEVGDRVGPGTPVASVVDATHLEVPVRLPASAHERIVVGSPCRLDSETNPARSWTGRVERVAPRADERTRTLAVYVEVNNLEQERPIVPGTFVRAVVEGATHPAGIVIPRTAIRRGFVLVVQDDRLRLRAVELERPLPEGALVRGGLSPGETIVTVYAERLTEGTIIRPHRVDTVLSPDRTAELPVPRQSGTSSRDIGVSGEHAP